MSERFSSWTKPVFDGDGWAYPDTTSLNHGYGCYGWRCQYSIGLTLGERVDIGCFTYMNAAYGIEIDDDVQIGSHCSIYSLNTENDTCGEIIIGKGSLIGSYCLILPGAIIKSFSKIRAYSIIKGD